MSETLVHRITTVQDIVRKRGDSFPIQWQVKENGVAMNITGAVFRLTVDAQPNPVNATTQKFQVSGIITDAAQGKVEFRPGVSNMDQTPDTYYYDLQMFHNTYIVTLAKGKFIIEQDITKETS